MLKGFIVGIIFTLLVALGTGYAVLRSGAISANADAPPSALEASIAGMSLDATLRNEAPKMDNPVAMTDANLLSGIDLYGTHCAICHGTAAGDASASSIAKGENPMPPQCAQRQFGAGDDRIGRRCHDGRCDTVDLVVSHTEAAYDEQILPLNEAAAAQFVKQCNNPRSLADHRIKETETIGTACILRSHG